MILSRQTPRVDSAVNCLPTIVVCAVTVSLAWVAILLRLWTRLRIVKMVGWDDWIMLTATVFFTVYCASVIDISTRVTSTHQIVSYNDLLLSVNLLNVAEVFYILSIMTLKIALAVFFLRLTVALWQRRVVLVTLAVSSSFSVLMFFFLVFQCGVYDNSTVFLLRRISNQCASNDFTLGMAYTHAILTTLTDWAFLVLPYFILKGSLMNQNEKRSVILILMFASVGGIASIVRFKFIHGLAIPGDEFFANARDIGIWSCLEPGIGIIAGSIVTLRPLIRRLVFLFKNSSYSSSRFPRQRSRPTLYKTPSSAPLQQSQHHEADSIFLQHQTSVHEMGIVEEKEVAKTETSKDSPFARRSSSGLPLYLFGSLRSKTSSRRTKSTKSSASMFSRFSIAPTIPDMTSFIWREATDETDEGSTKDSERDYDKNEEGGDPRTGPSTTWLEQDIKRGDLGTGLSPTSEEQQDWLEAQLSLEQLRPTKNEHERRFSQGTGLYSSGSSVLSLHLAPSSARAQSPRWQSSYESASSSSTGALEIPAASLSPLFPEGHEWHQTLNLGESRPSSYVPEPESARIPIGLQILSAHTAAAPRIPIDLHRSSAHSPPSTPHMAPRGTPFMAPRGTPRQSQSHCWHQRQGSENSVMQARIESTHSTRASCHQGRTSEDNVRWPSNPQAALPEEASHTNHERFSPRMSSRIYSPRTSSHVPLPQDNGVRFQKYWAAPGLEPTISPRRYWQQKPLPRPPPIERKPVPKGILKKPALPSSIPLPPIPPMPFEYYRLRKKEQEKRTKISGLPSDMFSRASSHASSSSKSSLWTDFRVSKQ